jgi:hypothetical protein
VSTALIVASGKVTASAGQLYSALGHYAIALKRKAPRARRYAILVTEVSPDKFNKPLRAFAQNFGGWALFHPLGIRGADECAILSTIPFEDQQAWQLTDLHLTHATTGRTAPIALTGAKPRNGPWLADWHTPAHTGGLDPRTWPTHVYLSAREGLKRAREDMGGGDGVVLAADWNIRLESGPVRDRLGKPYPNMEWSWHPGQEPTEGGRVIDGFLTNLPIRRVETLPREPGFDHHPVFALLGEAP